jgi:molybdate transport system regulatory protein
MKIAYKIWLKSEGKAFGEGPYLLLKGIEKTGSLHRAAMEIEMSYQKAWNILNNCEKQLGFDMIERRAGGVSGGGSNLTEAGKDFLHKYEQFRDDIDEAIEKIFRKHFG